MHRSLKIAIILIFVAGLASCDVLENQENPQALPADGGLSELGDYESALNGAYNRFQQFSGGDNFAQVIFSNDIIAEDAFWTGSFPTYVQIANQNMNVNNGSIAAQWNTGFVAINDANIILDGIDDLDASEDDINAIKGQAYFIRGMHYYYLVNYFSLPWGATSDNSHLGIPLQLSPVTSQDDFQRPSRATVAATYDQIIADLQRADSLAPDVASFTERNRASSQAATAILARIALIQQRWQDAADLSNEIITNQGQFQLNGSVTDYFVDESSDESIFEVQNLAQDVPDPANTSLTAVYNLNARDDIQLNDSYGEALRSIINDRQQAQLDAGNFTATDTRVTQLIVDPDGLIEGLDSLQTVGDVGAAPDADNTNKYEDNVNSADNLPIVRLPEMMLTRAEALVEMNGVNQESIDLVNEIRERAITVNNESGGSGPDELIDYTAADFSSPQELIDAILLERRVELSFEGHRKTDRQRRQLDVNGTAWDAPQLVFPIPQSQIDANTNIEQNEGYGG